MSGPVTVFMCRRRSDRKDCTGCGREAATRCTFPLRGKAAGKTCDRLLCEKCAGPSDLCPPHQRFDPPKDAA
jgi:hypothetical protein